MIESIFGKIESITVDTVIFGNTIKTYIIGLCFFFIILLLTYYLGRMIQTVCNRFSHKAHNNVLRVILNTDKKLSLLLKYIPTFVFFHYIKVPLIVHEIVEKSGMLIIVYTVIRYLSELINAFTVDYAYKANANKLIANSINLLLKLVLWAIGVLFILSNLGVNITTLIAGLGVGGMALALASKEILADLFNYFIITFDRPFSIDDSISVNGVSGTISSIGLRGSRVRSSTGELVMISNTDMIKSTIRNYTRMDKRRIQVNLGIKYEVNPEIFKKATSLVESAIRAIPDAEFSLAYFSDFGDSSLNIIVYYYISTKVDDFRLVVHDVNMSIYDCLMTNNIPLAYNTYSVHIEDSKGNLNATNGNYKEVSGH